MKEYQFDMKEYQFDMKAYQFDIEKHHTGMNNTILVLKKKIISQIRYMCAYQSGMKNTIISISIRYGKIDTKIYPSTQSFTSRKILFFVVCSKFLKFTHNACSMVLLSSSWVCCQTENKSIGEI